jgi:hypothetical protein
VASVAPTLIQEQGPGAKPVEQKREELAALPEAQLLGQEEVDALREIGDNTGCMALKGATPDHEGGERPDRWPLGPEQADVARRFGIDPERDLRRGGQPVAP